MYVKQLICTINYSIIYSFNYKARSMIDWAFPIWKGHIGYHWLPFLNQVLKSQKYKMEIVFKDILAIFGGVLAI